MISDYVANRPCYSQMKTIMERAHLMDLLSTYGSYTCFLPDNDAVDEYLKKRGLQSVDQLSDADCDTIARTHLIDNMYTTFMMDQKTIPTTNLLGRYLATSQGLDSDSNAVVYIEKTAHVIFEKRLDDGTYIHQNDSVENGIIQPVTSVLEKSNSFIADILRDDPNISIFYEALVNTGVSEQILLVSDPDYSNLQDKKYYESDIWTEVAWVPDTKKYGYTAFIEPDSIYQIQFEKYGISTSQGNLRALYDLACLFYDPVYPEDVNAEGHKFENLTSDVNPLRRFVQYHILNRYVAESDALTPFEPKETKEAFGFNTNLCNATEWFTTLLPYKMLKIEQLSRKERKDEFKINPHIDELDPFGPDVAFKGQHFVNRRYEAPDYEVRGAHVLTVSDIHPELEPDAVNGHYFYVDDLIVFSQEVRDVVQNMRIRMDFSAIFPEIMSNGIRLQGNYAVDDNRDIADDSQKPVNGRNYYFPEGYLDGVTFTNCLVVMRRPHCNFWSWQGDEWNLKGNYDFTFRIPPVPYSGEWQLRLGFCAIPRRGIMQTYFDGEPQGLPLDMTKFLNTDLYIGDRFASEDNDQLTSYKGMTDEDRAAEQKLLRNLGAYRAGRSIYHFNTGGGKAYFVGNERTYRKILFQGYIDATTDHFVRFRVGSGQSTGQDNEFMLDYFEMVPKSVYGVDAEGEMEDDL
jgi:uncharacterized surface protein with fasciclin (FAS1) repeats